ncbi:ferrichrome siderophore peptide synthetase [Fusarium sp. NRRL 52700]|nr:ferrichrome siderophore peptide synthetase [Fusarium sp. NRRL 52700]
MGVTSKKSESFCLDYHQGLSFTTWLYLLSVIAGHFNIPTENLSPGDSLAGLGLSSLQVTKLAWLLRRELKCQVGVLDLIRCESLGELVDVTLSRMPRKAEVDQSAPTRETEISWLVSIKKALTDNIKGDLRPSDTEYILPATPMQDHLDDVDERQLKRAWTAAAKRFDIPRTVFVSLTQLDVYGSDNTVSWAREKGVHSAILQLVREKPALHWSQIRSEEGQSLGGLAKLQLDLSPTTTIETPWAITFVEDTKKMMLSMHHALYDAVASDVILETVTSLYHMESLGNAGEVVQFETGLDLGLLPTPSKRDEAAALWSRRLNEISKTVSGGTLNAPFLDFTQSRQKQAQKILMSRKDNPSPFLQSSSTVALPTLIQSAFGCGLASYLELDAVILGHTISQRELWKEMAMESAQMFQSTHNLHPVDVKKMLNRGSGSSNTPFPGLFVYHPASDGNQAGASQSMFKEAGQALLLNVEHPLALNIFEANGTIELTGDGCRISQAQLDLLLDQILAQAQAMIEAPKASLAQLQNRMSKSLLSISGEMSSEEAEDANPTKYVSFHQSEYPDWVAVEEVMFQSSNDDEKIASKTITYAQLDKLTNAIATRLTQHQARLQPDDPVAMCLGRDIKSLAVTLAIFRAGFVYLPVDEDLPPARKQLLIRDAGARLVITTDELAGDLGLDDDNDSPLLLVPDTNDGIDTILSWPVSDIPSATGIGGYLLYTSGSTGRPKGVRVSNSNLCHFISAFSTRSIENSPATARLGGVGKYLNLTSCAFDPHLTQLFVPWHLGHRVVIGKDRTAMMANLKELINELNVTHFGSVPSVLSLLRLRPEDVPSVRVVTTGGEKASNELLNTWAQTQDSRAVDDRAALFNFYGPTEVTIGCLGHAEHQDSNARNLGFPLQGLEALLLCPNSDGDSLVIARRGQPGELCIAGPQVAMGYHNRPVVGFLKQVAGDKGDFEFAATVASTGDDSSNQQQQLLGFIARKIGSPKGQAEEEVKLLEVQDESTSLLQMIENECLDKLPAFMVPTLVWVTEIPYLAASGKVNTKILARLAKDFLASQQDRDGEGVKSGDLLGSQSSLSVKESIVVAAIEEAVGGSILQDLFDKRKSDSPSNSTTVSTLASTDDLHTTTLSVSDLGPLPEGLDSSNIETVLPCLPLQSALIARSLVWLSAFNERDSAEGHDVPYVAQFSYRLSRGTDIDRWRKTAEEVIASEAMLLTCFLQREDDGQIFQVVLRSLPSSPLGDYGHPADIVSQMNARPPIRLQLSDVDGCETIVSLNIHHTLFDGVAIDSLKNKLEAAYRSQTSSLAAASSLATLSAISNHCNLSNDELNATRRSWQQQLQGVQPCRVGAIDDNNTSGTMARQTFCLGYTTSELNSRLKAHSLGPEGTVSASSAFHPAVTLCLAQLTKQPSVVYGFIMSLKPLLDGVANGVDSFVGLCLNTLIRAAAIESLDETLPQLAQRVHKSHLDVSQGAMPLVSVDKVQRWSGSEDKLFDSLLSTNIVPANEPSDIKPGQLIALPTRSSSDMALAFDVDLHANGKIMLTLSSAGALNVKQLKDVGRLFEKVVYSRADMTVRVSDVVTSPLTAKAIPSNVSNGLRSDSTSTDESSYKQVLSDVQAMLSRFIHLDPSELSSKPDTTSLYQLGLDSITVLLFVKSINKSHKTKLSSHAVIKARTIKGVAQLLHDAKANSAIVGTVKSQSSSEHANSKLSDIEFYDRSLERLAKSLMFIATPLQEGMLSASLATHGDAYTYVHAIQLSDYALAHDTAGLNNFFAAVKDTVQACEILRTRFIFTDDDESPWVGIVSPTEQSDCVSWEVQPTVPGRVHLRIHHALYDATSIQSVWIILQNYRRRLSNAVTDGVETKHLYRPFGKIVACSQRASIAYWTDTVRDYTYSPLDFPSDNLKASSTVHFSLDPNELRLLQSKCRDHGESLYRQADVLYGEVVSTDAEDNVAIVGPVINTLPLRVKLGDSDGCISVSEALILVQKQIDSARGTNSMASLRKIQAFWRSGHQRVDAPAALFQSLFVFDGVLGSSNASDDTENLFKPVQAEAVDATGPAYDDYPLIVSFHVRDNVLNGKLRAKLSQEQADSLGRSLSAALNHVLHGLDVPVINNRNLNPVNTDAVLKLVDMVVGTRRGGKKIGYSTRLISVGLDSILAIRLSKLLKLQLRLNVSVFKIMKGASVRDIITRPASSRKPTKNGIHHQSERLREVLKSTIAKTLGQPEHLIKSIVPALSGQRFHLELWLHNGKRFFEVPWVYRLPKTFEQEQVAVCWSKLVKPHDVLRTTFAMGTTSTELYQVTFSEEWPARSRFMTLRDTSKTVEG